MENLTEKLVREIIGSSKVVIFSKSACPYCVMAKEVFDSINIKYVVLELDGRLDAPEIQKILGEMTGATTVPRVFIDGKCIGGGSDVKALHASGKLVPMLQ